MNTKTIFRIIAICVFMLFFIGTHNYLFAKEMTITGTVMAINWDEDDNVLAVSISVEIIPEDENEDIYTEDYIVADNEKGKELLNLVGETVEATGNVITDDEDSLIIYVKKYKVIEEEHQETDEDNPEYEDEPKK